MECKDFVYDFGDYKQKPIEPFSSFVIELEGIGYRSNPDKKSSCVLIEPRQRISKELLSGNK